MNRETGIARLKSEAFDVLVVGGGATGLGCALDSAARGYRTALIEAEDFAKGTSSRSTKLIHGGVRYLQQGHIALVREALHERARLLHNAPGIVHPLRFFVPARNVWDALYYRTGLWLYDLLAGSSDFPRSARAATGVTYWDAQFDDARLAVALARTAVKRGAAVANYVRALALRYSGGDVCGVDAIDAETQERIAIDARIVVNATGIFADALRRADDPASSPLLTYSRGSHIVVASEVLEPRDTALLVPRTADGRVLFAIPWNGRTLIGTTDLPAPAPEIEPRPTEEEIAFIIATANAFLHSPISRRDVTSAFAGLRPLVDRKATSTARLSREHVIEVSASGLVTIAGGKWTTYRKMAEDTIDAAERQGRFTHVPSITADLRLHDDTATIAALSETERVAHFAAHEMARTIDDVLARRTRALFTDAGAALLQARPCAQLLAQTLGRDTAWQEEQVRRFAALAAQYR